MKKKIIITITILLIVISALTLLVVKFIKNIEEDKKKTNENIEIIETSYNFINQKIEDYNQTRQEVSEFINNFYYNTIENNYVNNLDSLINYKNIIDEITKKINILDEKCNTLYNDSKINNICNNYKKDYEIIVNVYLNDINNYNNKLKSYNENNEKKLELFSTNYNYIDYNNDKIYEMKDEVNEKVKN